MAGNLGMFDAQILPEKGGQDVYLATNHTSGEIRFDLELRGQHPSAIRVLVNLILQSLSQDAGDIISIEIDAARQADRRIGESELIKIGYLQGYGQFSFDIAFEYNSTTSRDPIIRIFTRDAIKHDTFDKFYKTIRIWDSIIGAGGYSEDSQETIPFVLSDSEIYLVTPTTLEHPIFNLWQSTASFVGLCAVLQRVSMKTQGIRMVGVQ
jgi:hypothetical protein